MKTNRMPPCEYESLHLFVPIDRNGITYYLCHKCGYNRKELGIVQIKICADLFKNKKLIKLTNKVLNAKKYLQSAKYYYIINLEGTEIKVPSSACKEVED